MLCQLYAFLSMSGSKKGKKMEVTLPLSKEAFLSAYWQKKPLKIKGLFDPDYMTNLCTKEELSGLALASEVSSRLVRQKGGSPFVTHGPFKESDFTQLKAPFCLLVSGVDEVLEELATLKKPFDFIPHWRFDDVMVSYGTSGCGVGAHMDRYDVFLIQGMGKKEWRFGSKKDPSAKVTEEGDLSLLCEPLLQESFIMEPGDCLYIPPFVGHEGIPMGEAMTFSVGFRAAPLAEMAVRSMGETLYEDPFLKPRRDPFAIQDEDIEAARRQMVAVLESLSKEELSYHMGLSVTGPLGFSSEYCQKESFAAIKKRLLASMAEGTRVLLALSLRVACYGEGSLFIEGEHFPISSSQDKTWVDRLLASGLSYRELLEVKEDLPFWGILDAGLFKGYFELHSS